MERTEQGRTVGREPVEAFILVMACLLAALICAYCIYAVL